MATVRQPRRRFLWYVGIALLALMMPFIALAATVAVTGTVTVEVEEHGRDGLDLWVPVPALLIDMAVFAAPRLMPDHELDQARREIEPYLPALRQLGDEIEAMPDGVLVEVRDRGDVVRISKRWRKFHIEVDNADTDVHVVIPARLVGRTLDIFS